MPGSRTRHWNTPESNHRTRCGRRLNTVEWREDINDVDCNQCHRLHQQDLKRLQVQAEMQAWRTPEKPYEREP